MADAASILVSVRVKPPSTRSCVTATPGQEGSLIVEGRNGEAVLDGFASITGGSDQMEAYDAVAGPLVDRVMEGYSCTLMAYGQTGSGKTHTIFGPPGCLTEATLEHSANNDARSAPTDWGLFPRVALELLASGKGALHASAVEVYQERAYDLLADRLPLAVGTQKVGGKVAAAGKDKEGRDEVHKSTCKCRECYLRKEQAAKDRKAGLSVRASAQKVTNTGQGPPRATTPGNMAASAGETSGFATVGETLQPLRSAADVARLARTIELTRTAVGHLLNARSSRSHCLVHLHLTEQVAGGGVARRQLLFVDLAGSERILRSGAEGVAAQQAVAINASLTALGQVVRAVGAGQTHVPYRDSTLTQLLRSSLSGQSCTSVVIAVASDREHGDESKCSLSFGQRMQGMRTNAAVVGATNGGDGAAAMQRELATARRDLAAMEANGYAEHFGKDALPGEVTSFKENAHALEEWQRCLAEDRAALSEMQARGDGTDHEMHDLAAAIREGSGKVTHHKRMDEKRKSVAGFFVPARAVYSRKLAEVRALAARLSQLDESQGRPATATRLGEPQDYMEPRGSSTTPVRAGTAGALSSKPSAHALAALKARSPGPGRSSLTPGLGGPGRVVAHKYAPVPPWTAHVNKENGKEYFHNATTGESTYDRPAAAH